MSFGRRRNQKFRLQNLTTLAFSLLILILASGALYLFKLIDQASNTYNLTEGRSQAIFLNVSLMLTQRQPLENLANRIINTAEHFHDEFQLLVLDPDRADAELRTLQHQLQQQAGSLEVLGNFLDRPTYFALFENLGVLLDIADELLETTSPNERQQLYRDTVHPLESVLSSQNDLLTRLREENAALKTQVAQTATKASQQLKAYRQQAQQLETSIAVLFFVALFTTALIFWQLFRILNTRINLLSTYAEQIAEQRFESPPFSSKDQTGALAVKLALMGRKIRRLLRQGQEEANRANAAQADAERLAFYDPLTGLDNRRLFFNRLEHDLSALDRHDEDGLALLYIDLDNFKEINDSLGHATGDQVLKTVAKRLQLTVRTEDSLARLGGDEFAMLFHGSQDACASLADRVLEKIRNPVTFDNQTLWLTTSIGIAIAGSDGHTPSDLMSHADLALYKAKDQGRDNYQYFSEELQQKAQARIKLTHEIDVALEEEQFCLFYQPKVDISDRRIVGLEALIRWHHPEEGLVFPDRFISLAEETGQILPIGNWVIHEACRQAGLLQKEGIGVPISVNVSARQFYEGDLIGCIRKSLDHFGIPPQRLEVEITESLLMEDMDEAIRLLLDIRAEGVKTSIDDFGTGFSSLLYLKKLPLDALKIDREFVRHLPDDAKDVTISQTIIDLAHRLKLPVVAEGVENEAQLECLGELGCEVAQGYLFDKPQPIDRLPLSARHYPTPEQRASFDLSSR